MNEFDNGQPVKVTSKIGKIKDSSQNIMILFIREFAAIVSAFAHNDQ
jgi:hypothetical protein